MSIGIQGQIQRVMLSVSDQCWLRAGSCQHCRCERVCGRQRQSVRLMAQANGLKFPEAPRARNLAGSARSSPPKSAFVNGGSLFSLSGLRCSAANRCFAANRCLAANCQRGFLSSRNIAWQSQHCSRCHLEFPGAAQAHHAAVTAASSRSREPESSSGSADAQRRPRPSSPLARPGPDPAPPRGLACHSKLGGADRLAAPRLTAGPTRTR